MNHLLAQTVETFSQDFATAYTADWFGVIELGAVAKVAAGMRVVVEFDERVFAPGKATLFTGGSVRSLSPAVTSSGGRSRASFEIDRSFGGESESIGLGLPMTPRPLYPVENLGEFQPAILTLTAPGSDRTESFDLLGSVTPRPVAPWGVDVSGAWTTIEVHEQAKVRSYRVPNLVRIVNVGPCPAPTGTVTITADANLVERLVIESAALDGVPIDVSRLQVQSLRVSTELRVEARTSFEVPVGSALEVFIAPEPHGENPTASEGIVFARAEFNTSVDDARPRRSTGRSTFIDVTESGTVEQSDAAKGTV
ncbi:hypothetical protein ACPPVW_10880 [Leifsonia sp. McL0607]|uniref:hypothetical protein n=1 Tax=Leifsonia sp. McL0607 TaxID=3415672 RepID=UPI003CE92569